MSAAVKIIGLTLADRSKPWDNGDQPLAHFDCEARGFRLNGCVLIRAARGALVAQPPKGDSGRAGARAIFITDPELRESLAEHAYRVYQGFGGAE